MYKLISIYFFIGFLSDMILNYFSRQHYAPASIKALHIYFQRPSIKNAHLRDLYSAINAGVTIITAIVITMLLSKFIFNFYHPHSLNQFGRFLLIAFLVGYVMDIIIYKLQVFGSTLNPFYKIAGAGFWGAAAFIFSIFCYFGVTWLFANAS